MAKNTTGGSPHGLPSELLESIERRVQDVEAKAPEETHLGGDELDGEVADEPMPFDAEEQLRFLLKKDQARDEELARLRDVAARQNELLQQLTRETAAGGLDRAVREEKRRIATGHRRKLYQRIKEQGNRVCITIFPDQNDLYNRPVDVWLNGEHHVLERGKPIYVSAQILEILDNAVQDAYLKFRDEEGKTTHQHIFKTTYPYTIVDPALALFENSAQVAESYPI